LCILLAGELAKAVRRQSDLHFGLYHSLFEFFHPLYKEDKANNFTTRKFVQVVCISVYPVVNVRVILHQQCSHMFCVFHCCTKFCASYL